MAKALTLKMSLIALTDDLMAFETYMLKDVHEALDIGANPTSAKATLTQVLDRNFCRNEKRKKEGISEEKLRRLLALPERLDAFQKMAVAAEYNEVLEEVDALDESIKAEAALGLFMLQKLDHSRRAFLSAALAINIDTFRHKLNEKIHARRTEIRSEEDKRNRRRAEIEAQVAAARLQRRVEEQEAIDHYLVTIKSPESYILVKQLDLIVESPSLAQMAAQLKEFAPSREHERNNARRRLIALSDLPGAQEARGKLEVTDNLIDQKYKLAAMLFFEKAGDALSTFTGSLEDLDAASLLIWLVDLLPLLDQKDKELFAFAAFVLDVHTDNKTWSKIDIPSSVQKAKEIVRDIHPFASSPLAFAAHAYFFGPFSLAERLQLDKPRNSPHVNEETLTALGWGLVGLDAWERHVIEPGFEMAEERQKAQRLVNIFLKDLPRNNRVPLHHLRNNALVIRGIIRHLTTFLKDMAQFPAMRALLPSFLEPPENPSDDPFLDAAASVSARVQRGWRVYNGTNDISDFLLSIHALVSLIKWFSAQSEPGVLHVGDVEKQLVELLHSRHPRRAERHMIFQVTRRLMSAVDARTVGVLQDRTTLVDTVCFRHLGPHPVAEMGLRHILLPMMQDLFLLQTNEGTRFDVSSSMRDRLSRLVVRLTQITDSYLPVDPQVRALIRIVTQTQALISSSSSNGDTLNKLIEAANDYFKHNEHADSHFDESLVFLLLEENRFCDADERSRESLAQTLWSSQPMVDVITAFLTRIGEYPSELSYNLVTATKMMTWLDYHLAYTRPRGKRTLPKSHGHAETAHKQYFEHVFPGIAGRATTMEMTSEMVLRDQIPLLNAMAELEPQGEAFKQVHAVQDTVITRLHEYVGSKKQTDVVTDVLLKGLIQRLFDDLCTTPPEDSEWPTTIFNLMLHPDIPSLQKRERLSLTAHYLELVKAGRDRSEDKTAYVRALDYIKTVRDIPQNLTDTV